MEEQNKPYMAYCCTSKLHRFIQSCFGVCCLIFLYSYLMKRFCELLIVQIECHFRNKMDSKYLTITQKNIKISSWIGRVIRFIQNEQITCLLHFCSFTLERLCHMVSSHLLKQIDLILKYDVKIYFSIATVCFSPMKGTTFFIGRNLCSQDHNGKL